MGTSKRLTPALQNSSRRNELPNAEKNPRKEDLDKTAREHDRADSDRTARVEVDARPVKEDVENLQGLPDATIPAVTPIRSSCNSMKPVFEEEFMLDPADDDLIAWSQALRIDDVSDNDI